MGSNIPEGASPRKRTAPDGENREGKAAKLAEEVQAAGEEEHPDNFLTYMLKGLWLGQSMLIDFHAGKVTDRYLTQSIHGIRGKRFSRLTRRVYTDGRLETSFFDGEFESGFDVAVFRAAGTKWNMMDAGDDMVIISALKDKAGDPEGQYHHLIADSVITRGADGHYIHTRQIVVGNLVQIESVRSRRVSGDNMFLASADDAPQVDWDALRPHLDLLRDIEEQAARQLSSAILIYPGATTPTTTSFSATPVEAHHTDHEGISEGHPDPESTESLAPPEEEAANMAE